MAQAPQPSAADRTTARRLGIEGQIALKKRDFDTAADRFERANDLVSAPSFLVRLAKARVGQGRLVEAYEIYRTIIREGVEPDNPQAFKLALTEAQEEVKSVEPRLAWVTINVVGANPNQVEVSLNGSLIPSAALGAQRPADPGTLRVQAKAAGYRTAEAELQLAEGQHVPAIELRMVALPKEAQVAIAAPGGRPVMTADGGEPPFISQETLGYIALSVGAIGLGVGSVTGVIAINRRADLAEIECVDVPTGCRVTDPNVTALQAKDMEKDLNTFATTATVSFIAGGALAATGLLLLVLAPDEDPSDTATLRPYVGLGSIGAVGTF